MFVVVVVYFHFVANVFEAPFICGHFVTANEKLTRDSISGNFPCKSVYLVVTAFGVTTSV